MKADTPSSMDQSPSAVVSGRGRGKGTRKPRKPKNAKTPPVNPQQPPQMTQQVLQQQLQNQQQMHPNHQMGQMHMNMQVSIWRERILFTEHNFFEFFFFFCGIFIPCMTSFPKSFNF